MKCQICKTDFYPMIMYGNPDPGESCMCGEQYPYSPWEERDWMALKKQICIKIGNGFYWIGGWFFELAGLA